MVIKQLGFLLGILVLSQASVMAGTATGLVDTLEIIDDVAGDFVEVSIVDNTQCSVLTFVYDSDLVVGANVSTLLTAHISSLPVTVTWVDSPVTCTLTQVKIHSS